MHYLDPKRSLGIFQQPFGNLQLAFAHNTILVVWRKQIWSILEQPVQTIELVVVNRKQYCFFRRLALKCVLFRQAPLDTITIMRSDNWSAQIGTMDPLRTTRIKKTKHISSQLTGVYAGEVKR